MSHATGRRKIKNLVVDRRALVHLSIPFVTMGLMSIGTVLALRWKIMRALESTELTGLENLVTINALHDLQNSVTRIGAIALVVLTFVCLAMWIRYSHKIFGPTVAMRRHIQKLTEGDYSSRVHLRVGDELHGMGEDLNRLAEVLGGQASKNKFS